MLSIQHLGIKNAQGPAVIGGRQVGPGAPVAGDGYQVTDAPALPVHWPMAIERFAQSPITKEYFSKRFVEIYSAVKRSESQRYLGEISNQDYDWYLQTV